MRGPAPSIGLRSWATVRDGGGVHGRAGGAVTPAEGPDDAARGGRPPMGWKTRFFIEGERRLSIDSVSIDVGVPESVGRRRGSNDDPLDSAGATPPEGEPRTPAPPDADEWPAVEVPTRACMYAEPPETTCARPWSITRPSGAEP